MAVVVVRLADVLLASDGGASTAPTVVDATAADAVFGMENPMADVFGGFNPSVAVAPPPRLMPVDATGAAVLGPPKNSGGFVVVGATLTGCCCCCCCGAAVGRPAPKVMPPGFGVLKLKFGVFVGGRLITVADD